MKIIHVCRGEFNPNSLNGVYKVIDSISKELAAHNHEVSVLSVSGSTTSLYVPSQERYEHLRVKESKFLFPLSAEFKDFVETQPKDAVWHFHSVFIPWFLPAMRYVRRHGCKKIVLTPHGQYTDVAMDSSLKKRLYFRLIDSKVVRLADVIHVIGETENNKYIRHNNDNIRLIPNGCDIKIVHCDRSREKLIFGYMGRLEIRQKGLDTLLYGFSQYKRRGGQGILRLVGEGADKNELMVIIKKENISDSVFFDGVLFNDKKWNYLSSLAFFVHPSNWDVVPTSCMEAAACGVPLIISEETNLGRYVKGYGSGWLVQREPDDIAKIMLEAESVFQNKVAYGNLCINSLRMISNELNWTNITKRLLEEVYLT